MVQDIVIRVLLLPFALLYGFAIFVRSALYQTGLLRSVRFDLPVISVGNMSMGGTGKSPHIEYLLRWLNEYIEVGVLSRGYGRKTEGYRTVSIIDTAEQVGDEPLQFKRKFGDVPVSISESRALGVPEMVRRHPNLQCVLLDDAFQHLSVTPGLNILLTEFTRPFTRDWLLPSGRLREWRSGYRRADLIVVTKCPQILTEKQRVDMIRELDLYARQKVYFSYYRYGTPYHLLISQIERPIDLKTDILLVSAIANTDYLLQYLGSVARSVHTMEFEDHHYFKEEDLYDLGKRFDALESDQKIILTTEKDATRLELHASFIAQRQWPIFVLPAMVAFHGEDEAAFQNDVKQFLTGFEV
jgi:tetraacyldisaccharide 4'-kinase